MVVYIGCTTITTLPLPPTHKFHNWVSAFSLSVVVMALLGSRKQSF